MHEISYDEFCTFIKENIVCDEKGIEIIKQHLLNNYNDPAGEMVKATIEPSILLGDCNNLFIPNCMIYINLKRLTVLALACICDIFITKGAATALGVALGKINTCIYKLEIDDCCVFSKVLFYTMISNGVSIENLLSDYSGKCSCKANQRCPYFVDGDNTCKVKESNCLSAINNLEMNGVIEKKEGLLNVV